MTNGNVSKPWMVTAALTGVTLLLFSGASCGKSSSSTGTGTSATSTVAGTGAGGSTGTSMQCSGPAPVLHCPQSLASGQILTITGSNLGGDGTTVTIGGGSYQATGSPMSIHLTAPVPISGKNLVVEVDNHGCTAKCAIDFLAGGAGGMAGTTTSGGGMAGTTTSGGGMSTSSTGHGGAAGLGGAAGHGGVGPGSGGAGGVAACVSCSTALTGLINTGGVPLVCPASGSLYGSVLQCACGGNCMSACSSSICKGLAATPACGACVTQADPAGCGSEYAACEAIVSGSSTGTTTSVSTGTGAGGAGGMPACGGVVPTCNAPAQCGQQVALEQVASNPVAATGGLVVDGTYVVTQATSYTGPGGAVGPPMGNPSQATTYAFANGSMQINQNFVSNGMAFQSFEGATFATNGTKLTETITCPKAASPMVYDYSVSGSTLRLVIGQAGKTDELILTKTM